MLPKDSMCEDVGLCSALQINYEQSRCFSCRLHVEGGHVVLFIQRIHSWLCPGSRLWFIYYSVSCTSNNLTPSWQSDCEQAAEELLRGQGR